MVDLHRLSAAAVIEAFGGPSKAARALNVPITTVQSWKDKGRIPRWRHAAILAAAQADGVALPEVAEGPQPPPADGSDHPPQSEAA